MWITRLSAITMLSIGLGACATAPKTESGRQSLEANAETMLESMKARDPGLPALLSSARAYVVFPDIGKGALAVGAAHGRGVLFERGQPSGYVVLNQASLGAQLGGQTFAELIVFRDQFAVDQLKAGQFELGASVSAVALTTGAAGAASFADGVAVFTVPLGGLMAELSVTGQKLGYQPRG
jgi:lipid-binding SYLF domain-containing protein